MLFVGKERVGIQGAEGPESSVMYFLLKAVFWLGLVFLLLPDVGLFTSTSRAPRTVDAPSTALSEPGRLTPETIAQGVAGRALEFCRDNPETCARGAALIGEAADVGRRELPRLPATQDTLTPADLQAPFGGLAPPAGGAPRTAPLPPRRPV